MFFAHHPLASDCWQTQRQTQCSPHCAAKAGSVGVWAFFHGAIVVQQDGARIPFFGNEDSHSMSNFWPDGTVKSAGNAFTARPPSVFADDKGEKAKATLARKGSYYGEATGAVAHGIAVIPGHSKKAEMQLKAVPYSQPISPSVSGWSKSPTSTLIERAPSVCAQPHLSGGDE